MYKLYIKVLFGACLLFVNSSFSQDTPQNNRLTETQLKTGVNYVVDTIINGKTYYKPYTKVVETVEPTNVQTEETSNNTLDTQITTAQTIEPEQPTSELKDHELASKLDDKWIEELYSCLLYTSPSPRD